MCNNGRAPKDGPTLEWLTCLLYGYLRGYIFGGSRPSWVYRRDAEASILVPGELSFSVGGKRYSVRVEEV